MSDFDFSVHLPVSLVSDFSDLKMKTFKLGQIGRFLSIFKVSEVYIYDDGSEQVNNVEEEFSTISTLLGYLETPQYLRRDLFPYMDELKYAGILPPLRTSHHPLKDEKDEEGEIREAAVLEVDGGESILNIGLSEKGVIDSELQEGDRVTVELGEKINKNKRKVQIVRKNQISKYWGYKVNKAGNITQSIKKSNPDYSIGTSRYGQNLYEAVKGIKSKEAAKKLAVTFGGPYEGIFEICERQGVDEDGLFDKVVNTIPGQGTETVRTEEALAATLAVFNVMIRRN